jgi:putative Mn2+ efflux pump MntP
MDLLSVFLIALGLSMDCLAVAIAGSISMASLSYRQVWRTSLSFGLFQFLMLVLGWLAGQTVVDIVADYDHWIAFALLLLVAARMIWESHRSEKDSRKRTDITKGIALLTLSVATSIDALAVGLGLAALGIDVWYPSVIIGFVTMIVSTFAVARGKRVRSSLGSRAQIVGAIVLLFIALKVLSSHGV